MNEKFTPENKNEGSNYKEYALEVVKEDGLALKHFSEEVRNSKEVVIEAMKQDIKAKQFASEELQNDPDIIELENQKQFQKSSL